MQPSNVYATSALILVSPMRMLYLGRKNYARWLIWYTDTLLNIDQTHPGLKEQFKEGFLGVKRTNKPFSRIPVDLTLEQTINADAGRKLTRITHITNSIGARQRWSINYGLRCALISTVMEQCELSIVQEETNDLLPQKMKKSKNHLNHFMSSVLYRFNPFSAATRKDVLVNICTEDKINFKQYVIKRNKILNFASIAKKTKINVGGKIEEVKLQRDLSGRLLGISLSCKENISLEKILSFPLLPVSLSFCHLNGSINKTDPSILTKIM
ncbi:hypothetical protein TKK_0013512 [Trichogramma kaykai]